MEQPSITIEGRSLYWKNWAETGIYFIHDIRNEHGKFLTYDEFKRKFRIDINFINYFQILAASPTNLKTKLISNPRPLGCLLVDLNVFNLSNTKSIILDKMCCKNNYALFQEKNRCCPHICYILVQKLSKRSAGRNIWKELFRNISRLSVDDNLKQFSLVTKKKLKRFKIAPNDQCLFFKRRDSL